MIDHENLRQLLCAYSDQEVSPQEKKIVEEHLVSCSSCQSYFRQLKKIFATLTLWPDEELSPDLEQKIQKKWEQDKISQRPLHRGPWFTMGLSVSVLALLVAVFGFLQWQTQRNLQARNKTRIQVAARTKPLHHEPSKNFVKADEAAEREKSKISENKKEGISSKQKMQTEDTVSVETSAPASQPIPILPSEGRMELAKVAEKSSSQSFEGLTSGQGGSRDKRAFVSPEQESRDQEQPLASDEENGRRDRSMKPLPQHGYKEIRADLRADQPMPAGGLMPSGGEFDRMGALEERQSKSAMSTEDGSQNNNELGEAMPQDVLSRSRRIYSCVIAPCPPAPAPSSDLVRYPVPSYPANTEQYDQIVENNFLEANSNPLSTFSIDVDTASYTNVRRFISAGQLPPKNAVRIEEMINYFHYDYPQPEGEDPLTITTEVAPCPWNPQHNLVLIGLQGKNVDVDRLPPANLIFLIDVSGSMDETKKLPLLKSAFKLLVNQLRDSDRVTIVTYAGAAGVALPPTAGSDKEKILSAIDALYAGGSTAGGEGIKLAYRLAAEHFISGGNNRIILATDGDFNVGVSSDDELINLIESKRNEGIFLSVLGFGTGNYKDSKMEKLADHGNGNYGYIDNILEGQKVFVQQLGGTLLTIAKDVKIQIEFNPGQVKAYRLLGFEDRGLAKEDFNNDMKDAGDMGAGHSVTALYEIVDTHSSENFASVDPLKYQRIETPQPVKIIDSQELLTIKLRYKKPDENQSHLITRAVQAKDPKSRAPSANFQFASGVAEFGLLLRESPYRHNASYEQILQRARAARGEDPQGYRAEFIRLVESAALMSSAAKPMEPSPSFRK